MLLLTFERQRRGLSQTTLAVLVGAHQVTISGIECGRLNPTPSELQRLADALDVHPPEKLLERVTLLTTAG